MFFDNNCDTVEIVTSQRAIIPHWYQVGNDTPSQLFIPPSETSSQVCFKLGF